VIVDEMHVLLSDSASPPRGGAREAEPHLSAGIAQLRSDDDATFFERADEALDQTKEARKAGKGQSIAADGLG